MDVLNDFINNPIIKDWLISYIASISFDGLNGFIKKFRKEDSFEFQFYQLMRDTFEEFYLKFNLEFEENVVMKSFAEAVQKTDFNTDNIITKKVIFDTIGLNIDDKGLEEWIKIFKTKCSHPRYQWIYNKIVLGQIKIDKSSKNTKWMDYYMNNNHCMIQCDLIDKLPAIFNDIKVKISPKCWYDTKMLIWEIIFNAQEHGNAKKIMLNIRENSITIIDDGKMFNPLLMQNQSLNRGGSLTIENYKKEYPEIKLNNKYYQNYNQFTIEFEKNVFDVNGMSEIIIPTLADTVCKFHLKYPNGKFKYYYIDIDEVDKDENGMLFVTISGLFKLFYRLKNEIIKQTSEDKIFIYFSDMSRDDYQWVFDYMNKVLENLNNNKEEIEIILIKDDDNLYSSTY